MRKLLCFPLLLAGFWGSAQSVGIGTTTPNNSSSLDLGTSAKPLILPRLTTAQMNTVSSPAQGMIVYNTDEHQLYSYMRFRSSTIIGQSSNRWQPVSTGPRMLAWGIVDSLGTVIAGSGTFFVSWNTTDRWYRMGFLTPHEYYKDSMMLMITPVGNGSWDQAVATGELIEGDNRYATIKFIDISRSVAGWPAEDLRRRSWFHFIVYDLRKEPY